jgi:hypothetical protein
MNSWKVTVDCYKTGRSIHWSKMQIVHPSSEVAEPFSRGNVVPLFESIVQ